MFLRELLSNETLAADTMASLAQAQEKLELTQEQIVENEKTRDLLIQEVQSLRNTLTGERVTKTYI